MKNNKQEAIEKAYGEHWEKLKKYVDSDGCIPYEYLEDDEYLFNFYDNIDTEYNGDSWRPISLKGLETNNGWIRIESEEDLPKDWGSFWAFTDRVIFSTYNNVFKYFQDSDCDSIDEVTHYMPIQIPENPIY